MRPRRDEQAGLAHPVGLQFLDDDAIEQWAQEARHICAATLRRGHGELQPVTGQARAGDEAPRQADERRRSVHSVMISARARLESLRIRFMCAFLRFVSPVKRAAGGTMKVAGGGARG